MTTPLDYRRPAPARPFSLAGLLSLVLGIVPVVVYLMIILFDVPDAPAMVVVAAVLGLVGAPLFGLLLGIRSLRTPGLQRGLAIAGVILNGLFVALLLANVLLYLALA